MAWIYMSTEGDGCPRRTKKMLRTMWPRRTRRSDQRMGRYLRWHVRNAKLRGDHLMAVASAAKAVAASCVGFQVATDAVVKSLKAQVDQAVMAFVTPLPERFKVPTC